MTKKVSRAFSNLLEKLRNVPAKRVDNGKNVLEKITISFNGEVAKISDLHSLFSSNSVSRSATVSLKSRIWSKTEEKILTIFKSNPVNLSFQHDEPRFVSFDVLRQICRDKYTGIPVIEKWTSLAFTTCYKDCIIKNILQFARNIFDDTEFFKIKEKIVALNPNFQFESLQIDKQENGNSLPYPVKSY